MKKLPSKYAQRIFILMIDAADPVLIKNWIQAGELANFAYLIKNGSHGELTTTIPSSSPAAWCSFMTGVNPGKHGVFHFFDNEYSTSDYQRKIVNSTYLSGKTLWEIFSRNNLTSQVYGILFSYPPPVIKGQIICPNSLLQQKLYPSTYPADLAVRLATEIPQSNFRPAYPEQPWLWLSEARNSLQNDFNKIEFLLKNFPDWQLFVAGVRELDAVQHLFFKYLDETHPNYQASLNGFSADYFRTTILQFYKVVDNFLGYLKEMLPPDTHLIILSDHGCRSKARAFYLNKWLSDLGLLKVKKKKSSYQTAYQTGYDLVDQMGFPVFKKFFPPQILKSNYLWFRKAISEEPISGVIPTQEIDWRKTKAFFDTGFWINLIGREPQGIVQAGAEYQAVCETILKEAEKLRDPITKLPPFQLVSRNEIYHGALLDKAPDILFQGFPGGAGVNLNVNLDNLQIQHQFQINDSPCSGCHESGEKGIIILNGPGIKNTPLSNAHIMDIFPTVLGMMSLPISSAVDGRPLIDAFQDPPDFKWEAKKESIFTNKPGEEKYSLDPQVQAELRQLGYIS